MIAAEIKRLTRGAVRYGPLFVGEVLVFWLILLAVDYSGYGAPTPTTHQARALAISFGLVVLAMGAAEARFHLYRRVWSVAGLNDAFAIGSACVEASLLITSATLLFPDGFRPLRLLAPVVAAPAVVIGVGLLRLLPRPLGSPTRPTGNRLLVVIADAAGYGTVKALLQQPNAEWSPIAIVTLGVANAGQTLLGVPVLGTSANLRRWIRESEAQGVAFVPGRSADRHVLRKLYAVCLAAQLPVFIIPAPDAWIPRFSASRLRQLSADDLVGRDERNIDLEVCAGEVRNRTVLVTGAAGSIGSELCRLLATMGPRRLVLADMNESGLFELAEELRLTSSVDLRECLVSIVEHDQLLAVFVDERPEIVFHAAAYKHVPMLEAHPVQAVLTNVTGTWNTVRCRPAAGR